VLVIGKSAVIALPLSCRQEVLEVLQVENDSSQTILRRLLHRAETGALNLRKRTWSSFAYPVKWAISLRNCATFVRKGWSRPCHVSERRCIGCRSEIAHLIGMRKEDQVPVPDQSPVSARCQ